MNPLPFVRHSLGAEELIELGRTDRPSNGNQPFLAGRTLRRPALGQPKADDAAGIQAAGMFVKDALDKDLGTLGNIVLVPMDIMAKSGAVTFRAVGDLLDHVPSIDVLLGRILLLGNAAIQFSLPARDGFENILGGIAKAMAATGTGAQNQRAIDGAQAAILAQASDKAQDVKKILDTTGVTGDDLFPAKPEALPATPPPAGMQGTSLGRQGPESVLLMFSKG